MAKLVVYSRTSICPKCGWKHDGGVQYHEGKYASATVAHRCGMHDLNQHKGPHMHQYCTCGYDWCEMPLDQVGKPPLPPPAQMIKEGAVPK